MVDHFRHTSTHIHVPTKVLWRWASGEAAYLVHVHIWPIQGGINICLPQSAVCTKDDLDLHLAVQAIEWSYEKTGELE